MYDVKVIPHAEFNKYDLALGKIFRIENESKKYIRKRQTYNIMFGFMFLWFSFGFEIKIELNEKGNQNDNTRRT